MFNFYNLFTRFHMHCNKTINMLRGILLLVKLLVYVRTVTWFLCIRNCFCLARNGICRALPFSQHLLSLLYDYSSKCVSFYCLWRTEPDYICLVLSCALNFSITQEKCILFKVLTVSIDLL